MQKKFKSDKNEKKFGAHTHLTQHMTAKCCNITTTVNNASISKSQFQIQQNELFI